MKQQPTAHRVLAAKGTLVAAYAEQIEAAFQQKLTQFESASQVSKRRKVKSRNVAQQTDNPEIDKSNLATRNSAEFAIASTYGSHQTALSDCRTPSDPHHVRHAQHRALGRKVSDEFTVPLCRGHHREVHRCGDEAAWWEKTGIDPIVSTRVLWLKTHPPPERPTTMCVRAGALGAGDGPTLSGGGAGPSLAAPGRMTKRTQFLPQVPHELAPTDRGERPQCFQEHGAKN
jgi:hypothetical protein